MVQLVADQRRTQRARNDALDEAGFIDVACPQGSDTAPDVLQKLADAVVRDGCLQVGRGAEMMGDASVRHA